MALTVRVPPLSVWTAVSVQFVESIVIAPVDRVSGALLVKLRGLITTVALEFVVSILDALVKLARTVVLPIPRNPMTQVPAAFALRVPLLITDVLVNGFTPVMLVAAPLIVRPAPMVSVIPD